MVDFNTIKAEIINNTPETIKTSLANAQANFNSFTDHGKFSAIFLETVLLLTCPVPALLTQAFVVCTAQYLPAVKKFASDSTPQSVVDQYNKAKDVTWQKIRSLSPDFFEANKNTLKYVGMAVGAGVAFVVLPLPVITAISAGSFSYYMTKSPS